MGRSWKLYNIDDGSTDLVKGRMTIRLTEGSIEELPSAIDRVTQRVGKCTIEPKGSNPFSDNWGSRAATLLGQKLSPEEVAREIGTDQRVMIDGLIVEQAKTARSVPLEPLETIQRLGSVSVSIVGDTIGVGTHVVLGNGTVATANATVA